MEDQKIKINRAPVMTLWAAIVAERMGFNWQEALTLGKVVSGLNAQSKGQRIGIYEPEKEGAEKARKEEEGKEIFVKVLGRPVPALNTPEGLRAASKGKPVAPASVERYLHSKFGEALPEVKSAMEQLACSYSPQELADKGYSLYEKFRPSVPEGTRGWGAYGTLDLNQIRSLEKK